MSQVSLPFPNFVPDTTIKSGQVNANNAALVAGINGVDNTNIGPAGIYASQVIPLTALEATFGGSAEYTFTQATTAAQFVAGSSSFGPSTASFNGPVQAGVSTGGTLAYVPPHYTFGGASFGQTTHSVGGKVVVPVASGRAAVSTIVALSGASVFVGEPAVTVSPVGVISVPGWTAGGTLGVSLPGAAPFSSIVVNLESNNGTTASTGVSVPAYLIAMGA